MFDHFAYISAMASPIASCSTHTLDVEDDLIDHLLILYASETGNAQDTAERVGREVRRRGRRCVVQSMDRYDVVSDVETSLYFQVKDTADVVDGITSRFFGNFHHLYTRERRSTTNNVTSLDDTTAQIPPTRYLRRYSYLEYITYGSTRY